MRIGKDDIVKVITGEYKGHVGRVLRVLRKANKVVVEGANKVFKHVRKSPRNPRGGRVSLEMPIHVSNVQLHDEKAGRGVRVGIKIDPETGERVRVSKKTGRGLLRDNKPIRPEKRQ